VKSYDPSVITALGAPNVRLVMFIELELDGPFYVRYAAIGHDIVWNSVTWSGLGKVLAVDPIREIGSIESTGVRLTLSGVPSDLISLARQEHVLGRRATIWVGVYSEAGALIAAPVKEFEGRIDNMEIDDASDNSQVLVSLESKLVSLMSAENALYTDAEQRRRSPNDGSMRFVNTVVERTLAYGPKQ
jgi:hypothetical protein